MEFLATGDTYEGQWIKGIREGKGKFIWKDGKVYDGDYSNNKKHGFGTLTMYAGCGLNLGLMER